MAGKYSTVRYMNSADPITKQSKAKQSKAKQNKAKQNKAKLNKTKQSKAKQNKAEQSEAKQSKAKQSKAKQSKAKQSKAKQNKTKQNKGRTYLFTYFVVCGSQHVLSFLHGHSEHYGSHPSNQEEREFLMPFEIN